LLCVESGATGVQRDLFEEREAEHQTRQTKHQTRQSISPDQTEHQTRETKHQTRQSAEHYDDNDAEYDESLALPGDDVVS